MSEIHPKKDMIPKQTSVGKDYTCELLNDDVKADLQQKPTIFLTSSIRSSCHQGCTSTTNVPAEKYQATFLPETPCPPPFLVPERVPTPRKRATPLMPSPLTKCEKVKRLVPTTVP
ncbi:hypothetical protein CEXT_413371 [Caerostris extrusa]|uniref:Uncharacterized protein n=1 Tax=Caerostris extrusa TaxID=172846 RepID=A0AAV4N0J5_CAEEX|nr:hypothetical protein CEXT_413371 [Caerostris extrusa]